MKFKPIKEQNLYFMGFNVSIKLFLDISSLLEKMLKKPSAFFNIMITIKISSEKSFVYEKCFSEVKTFNSFWMFSVTAEKVGEAGGDGCSRSV
jgi:hypothetical protein